ncbi:hypothetical protein CPB86DRAFT_815270 [Serendipita vermifera]|nr:hypothetical protein CPB86DRAFT_815270 [Serendipita vermifera]
MPTRRKVRRTSSLPGLVSDDPTGLSLSGVAGLSSLTSQSHLSSSTPSVPPPAYSFTFTTNLTPTTFQHADKASSSSSNDKSAAATTTTTSNPTSASSTNDANGLPAAAASPANSTASNSRKRTADVLDDFYTDNIPSRANRSADQPASHSRKTAPGHIPRPPNAFILFRSDLVARKAVPTSLEADHSTISKIIGVCWRTLPARQRKRWEQKALEAKAAHKAQYPDYRYTPVHRKNGPTRKKAKKEQKKDDARCEELAQMLLSGSKGADLEARVRKLDESNPDNYQATLNFGTKGNGGGAGGGGIAVGPDGQPIPQQFTFVQGFPAAGHTIELPSAPPIHPPGYPSFTTSNGTPLFLQPRRHSSAPPADGAFMDHHPSSSSGASTPRTPARDLSAEGVTTSSISSSSFYGTGETTSPSTDSLVPLSRIARKLPTKSTHHLQPHHFFAEAQLTAAAEAAAASGSGSSGVTGNGRKIKSSLSKAVRSRAQGFGAPQPASERDQLFIQSHWTNAAVSGVDPSVALLGGEKKRKKKGAYGAGGAGEIPREMIVPTWDLNAHQPSSASGDAKEKSAASPALSNQALPTVPGFISVDQYSPAFAPAYVSADAKYNPFDAPPGSAHPGLEGTEGIGPFDMVAPFDEYGFAMAGDPLMGGIPTTDGMVAPDLGGFGGFDFADQFETLGVDGNEDYTYHQPPYYSAAVDMGSGPASANSTSPHSSDVDDAIAYSAGVPAPLHMSAQDPLAYSPHHHPYQQQMHAQAPMQQVAVHSHHVAHASSSSSSYLPLGPPTPLDAVGAGAAAGGPTGPIVYGANPDWSAFDNSAAVHGGVAVPLESIDPLEPLENVDGSAAPTGYAAYPPLPASAPPSECNSPTVVQLQRPSPHLQFRPPHVHAHGLAHGVGQQQRIQVPLTLNMQYTHPGGAPPTPYGYPPSSATSPVTADIAEQMNAFTMAQTPQHQHQPLQQLPPGTPIKASPMVYHHPHHSHTQSMEAFHGVVDQGDQWTEWTHPDPFHPGLVGDPTGANPGDGISTV